MILITGATGHLGNATIDSLLKKGINPSMVSAFIRDEAKAISLKERGINLVKGDFEDYQSLLLAFKNVDTLFFVSSSDIFKRQEQHENVIRAAKEVGVRRIVFTSVTRKSEDGSSAITALTSSLISTEKMIKEGGFTYTLLKNPLYADVLPLFLGADVLTNGVFLPTENGKASFVTREDLGEAAAEVLMGTSHDGKEYILANEVNYSFQDVADILSSLLGKTISYNSPSVEAYTQILVQAGVPAENIIGLVSFLKAIKQGEFQTDHTDLPVLLGRKPTSLSSYLNTVYFKDKNI
ncbi:SDR family oxidoreductase [Pedobacter steynii]|uniref:NmrA-like domain-containing protein n=1 Tax=Pedobacter steynii TaxID=430522 RepID=A0A1D7QL42_9SPHI|nr:SDR family oxidoreductase [Pedobacter steynii]AOM79329.1 hypothetical protein BFS30_20450 [Pedobacter steynii]